MGDNCVSVSVRASERKRKKERKRARYCLITLQIDQPVFFRLLFLLSLLRITNKNSFHIIWKASKRISFNLLLVLFHWINSLQFAVGTAFLSRFHFFSSRIFLVWLCSSIPFVYPTANDMNRCSSHANIIFHLNIAHRIERQSFIVVQAFGISFTMIELNDCPFCRSIHCVHFLCL